jgi:hypothetical protein
LSAARPLRPLAVAALALAGAALGGCHAHSHDHCEDWRRPRRADVLVIEDHRHDWRPSYGRDCPPPRWRR